MIPESYPKRNPEIPAMTPQDKTRDSPIVPSWTLRTSVELEKSKAFADLVNPVNLQFVNMSAEIGGQIFARFACLASVVQEKIKVREHCSESVTPRSPFSS